MDDTVASTPDDGIKAAVDEQGRLIEDVGCRRCGYNLRSLPADGKCPECGSAVAISIHGFYLRFAPPAWVRRLALGAKLLVVSVITTIVGWVALMAIAVVVALLLGPTGAGPSSTFSTVMGVSSIGFSILIAGLVIAGIILMTARDPAEAGKPERFGARRLARLCLWPMPVAMVGGGVVSALGPSAMTWPLSAFIVTLWIVIIVASAMSYLIMPAAVLRLLMGLMKRAPRPGLVTFAKIEFWAYLVVSTLGVIGYAVSIVLILTLAAPAIARAAAISTSGPAAITTLSQLGYVGGPASAPAGGVPGAAVGGSGSTNSFPIGGQVTISGPGGTTTMPTSAVFGGTQRSMMLATFAMGIAGLIGVCGGFAVAIAGLVLLIMVRRALANAALEAAGNVGAMANG